MKNLRKSVSGTLAMFLVSTFLAQAGFAQSSGSFEAFDDPEANRSKIADIDIVTNSPTLQGQAVQTVPTSLMTSQPLSNSPAFDQAASNQSLANQSLSNQYRPLSSQSSFTQSAPVQPTSQPVAVQPIQVDTQTVGRVVGVAGTALLLGAFLKNGGIGGMMNSFGMDNRFHSRGSSLAPY